MSSLGIVYLYRDLIPPHGGDLSSAEPKPPSGSPNHPSIVKMGDQKVTVEGTKGPVTRHLNVYDVIGVTFTLPQRYVLLDLIGRGAYGTVCAAKDNLTGEQVSFIGRGAIGGARERLCSEGVRSEGRSVP